MSARVPVRVGWLSGVSRPGTNALSPEQAAFVAALPAPDSWKLRTNFPYSALQSEARARQFVETDDGCEEVPSESNLASSFRSTPLLVASAVNLARFAAASQPLVRAQRRAAWRALKDSCDRVLLVTLSAGAQMVAALERAAPGGATVELLTLGAVDWRRGLPSATRVRGERDTLARLFGRRDDTVVPGLGHMDYAASDEVLRLASEWVRDRLGEAPC